MNGLLYLTRYDITRSNCEFKLKICDWNPYSTGMILYPQKDKLHSIAIPAAIQKSSVRSLGTRIIMTKFVDAPVVDSIPLRSLVLYTGHV